MRNNLVNTNTLQGINVITFCILALVFLFYISFNPLFGQTEKEPSKELQGEFRVDRTEYILDEPIYITFTITNVSNTELSFISAGLAGLNGTYVNGKGHYDSFIFAVKDNKGNPTKILYPYFCDGGAGRSVTQLLPGKSYTRKLLLNKYCLIEKPDVYTVDCEIDLEGGNIREVSIKSSLSIKVNPGDTDKLRQILEKLKTDLAAASEGLSFVPNEMVVPYLIKALDIDDIAVQLNAINGLGRIGNQDCIKALIKALVNTDKYMSVRGEAAGWLGQLKAKESLNTLHQLLSDKSPTIREYVLYALGAMGDSSSIPEIKKKLNDPDKKVREAAEKALE